MKTDSDLYYTEFATPIGALGILASDRGARCREWCGRWLGIRHGLVSLDFWRLWRRFHPAISFDWRLISVRGPHWRSRLKCAHNSHQPGSVSATKHKCVDARSNGPGYGGFWCVRAPLAVQRRQRIHAARVLGGAGTCRFAAPLHKVLRTHYAIPHDYPKHKSKSRKQRLPGVIKGERRQRIWSASWLVSRSARFTADAVVG